MKVRELMFVRGAQAAGNVMNTLAAGYVCPICLNLHVNYRLLTEEHAPQKSIGGKVICLTCRKCNSEAGSAYEFMLKNESQGNSVFGKNPVQATMELHDLPLRGTFAVSEDGMKFIGHEKQNDPKVVEEIVRRIREWESVGEKIKIRGRVKFDQRKVDVAYLKSAFLAAFARFGYGFAAHPALSIVRAQIRNPGQVLIPSYRLYRTDEEDIGNKMFVVERPESCIVCIIRKTIIFLPVPDKSGLSFYKWLGREIKEDFEKITFEESPMMDWPTSLEMRMDFAD